MFRSVLAVVCGYLAMAVLVVLMTIVLVIVFPEYKEAAEKEQTPPTLPIVINLVVGTLFAFAGGYVTGVVSKRNKRQDALYLAGLIFLLGIASAAAGWGGVQPNWYLILLPLLGGPAAALGGMLHPVSVAPTEAK